GDFNGDDRLDLAVAHISGSAVSILLGNADGTFQPAQNFATGAPLGSGSLAVGDFNKGGKLDLVTANNTYLSGGDGDVSVLLGNGNGTFQAPTKIAFGSEPRSVSVGDFNGDGKLDLAVTSRRGDYYGDYGFANVLLGNGDGSFSAPKTTALGFADPVSAVVADFNGDGRPDVATANADYGTLSVLLNDGFGNLRGPTNYSLVVPESVAAGDVNHDGNIDLVTATNSAASVNVLLGNGLCAFGSAQQYATGGGTNDVVLADFNNEGNLDRATVAAV